MGWTNRHNEETISPSTKIANNKSSTGFNRKQNAEQDRPVTRGEIMDYYAPQFKIKSTRGWVNSFVLTHWDEVIQTKRGAQEGHRWQVPRALLERIIQDLHEYLQGSVAELVFNLDEVGIADWEDRKTNKVIILAAIFGQTTHHGVFRNVKHISVIACLSAAGESLLNHIVTSQNCSTVQEHLRKQCVYLNQDFTWNRTRSPTSTLASSSTISEPSSYHILILFLLRRSLCKRSPSC
jgi:hypothetical protein